MWSAMTQLSALQQHAADRRPPAPPRSGAEPAPGGPCAPASSWGPASDGRWRWAVRVDAWRPAGGEYGEEFQFLLNLIPPGPERAAIFKSDHFVDRKRAIVSQLLMRRACAAALGQTDFEGLGIRRTHGRKPFLMSPLPDSMPNFNFNVSHDGCWVVLASDPLGVVGVDVSAPQRSRGDPEDDTWIEEMTMFLFQSEVDAIWEEQTVRDRYAVFQQLWSAKEAVTKAIGQGLDFGIERIEVDLHRLKPLIDVAGVVEWFQSWLQPLGLEPAAAEGADLDGPAAECAQSRSSLATPAEQAPSIAIDLWSRPEWRLTSHRLADDHWVSVALGPVEEVVDQIGEFSGTLRLRGLSAQQLQLPRGLDFEELSIELLLPCSLRQQYRTVQRGSWPS